MLDHVLDHDCIGNASCWTMCWIMLGIGNIGRFHILSHVEVGGAGKGTGHITLLLPPMWFSAASCHALVHTWYYDLRHELNCFLPMHTHIHIHAHTYAHTHTHTHTHIHTHILTLQTSVILQPLSNETVIAGRTVHFKCEVTKGVPPPTVSWTKDGLPLNIDRAFCSEGGETCILKITEVGRSDEGTYTCTIKNSSGKDLTSSAKLTVLSKRALMLP